MDIRALLSLFSVLYFLLLVFRSSVESLPVTNSGPKNHPDQLRDDHKLSAEEEKKIESEVDDLGLEYGRYLQQVVEALEQDKEFAKKLENVSQDEIKNGAIARELNLVDHNVRNKLDELKRIEIERLRALARREHDLEREESAGQDGERRWRTLGRKEPKHAPLDAEHVDHQNPHSFEAEDLQKLILQATKDLEALDAKRREDFKQYEMEKEIHFREQMVNLTDGEREKAIKEHQAEKEAPHAKVHHPGSKKQLEQVWEEKDGLPAQEFDPKVFFTMHDVNGDGFLDPEEVEAILTVEVKKLYSDARADPNEMQEEYHRMREHIYKEADANRDGLISKKEFLEFTRRMEFEKDEGWKGLDEQQVFSEEELKRYQQQRYGGQNGHGQDPNQQHRQDQYQYYQNPQHFQGQQYGHHVGQGQGARVQYVPVQQYIPPPQQMSAEEWHALQQQYYAQQLHAPQHVQAGQAQGGHAQIPNAQLHAQQQFQGQHAQQQFQGQHMQQPPPQHVQMGHEMPAHAQPPHMQMQGHPGQVGGHVVDPNIRVGPPSDHPSGQHMGGQPAGGVPPQYHVPPQH